MDGPEVFGRTFRAKQLPGTVGGTSGPLTLPRLGNLDTQREVSSIASGSGIVAAPVFSNTSLYFRLLSLFEALPRAGDLVYFIVRSASL